MCIAGIPVPIYQSEEELSGLRKLVQAAQPLAVLEIGSLFGGTLWCWMQDSAPGATIVSVDTGVQAFDYRHEEVECARRLWPTWANSFERTLIQVRSDSRHPDTVRKVGESGPFDFIFIDGGHDEATVWADIENYWPMVNPDGGFIALHDIAYPDQNPVNFQVGKVWREFRHRTGGWSEILRATNPEGIWGIGVAWR